MSKTITIPANCNPYVVVINNHVYVYKAGQTLEVPDEVAEAIEDALELEPKPLAKGNGDSRLAQLLNQTLTEVTEEDFGGATKIVPYALAYCSHLARVEIPSSVTNIETSAFHSCISLKSVEMPSGVTSIGNFAFYNCKSLESVAISNSVASIGGSAFELCLNLSRVYLPPKPPALGNINAFDNIKADCVFYCKTQASKDAYLSDLNWSTLAGTYSFAVEE